MRFSFIFGIFGLSLFLAACGSKESSPPSSPKELASLYCGSCHLSPEPTLLPKSAWNKVLLRMGARMGIRSPEFNPYAKTSMQERYILESALIYPESPSLPDSSWQAIQKYFLEHAPDSLDLPELPPLSQTSLFRSQFPELNLPGPPSVTLLEYEPTEALLYLSDWKGNIIKYGENFVRKDNTVLPKPVVDIERQEEGQLRLLSIGNLYPRESISGALIEMKEGMLDKQSLLFDQLSRPVHFISTDLDKDEHEDFVICAFGNQLGSLLWYEREGNGFAKYILKNIPGASRVFADDLDKNGFQDLVVLFGQGEEGVSIFYNKEGKFREDKVIALPPVYGSNDFEFLDVNDDGHKDIIITQGDNGDHSNVLKPYHGLRIFLNNGKNEFSEKYFYPQYGASKVRANDYDQDGDIDFFLMSFFPDFERGLSNSLIYLENLGNWNFEAFKVEGADQGRWMLMDAGDLDQDGDIDLFLGSFLLNSEGIDENLLNGWKQNNQPILFLENLSKNK